MVEFEDAGKTGRGECVPYERYGEDCEKVISQITKVAPLLCANPNRDSLQQMMPPGAARNALDCALWDLEAKRSGLKAHDLAGLKHQPAAVITAFTLSLMNRDELEREARQNAHRPLLKLKMGGAVHDDLERVEIVRRVAPSAKIIVDANEAWTPGRLPDICTRLAALDVSLIEQPLPAGADRSLGSFVHPVPICADESAHECKDIPRLQHLYDAVNIKLDKTGGLTHALQMSRRARSAGLGVMVGCMVCTSLSIAPALILAQDADFVDLDGPLLLRTDRNPGLRYEGSVVHPAQSEIWG